MDNNRQLKELSMPCISPDFSVGRILHAVIGLPPINIYVGGLLRAKNMKFADVIHYLPRPEGKYDIQIYSAEDNSLLLEFKEYPIPGGQIFTTALTGTLDDIKPMEILDDINLRLYPDETKVRFYNLSTDPLSFIMTSNKNKLSTVLSPNKGSEYIQTTPGEYRLEISTETGQLLNIKINLNPGKIYTIYALGSLDPTDIATLSPERLQIIQSVDGNTLFKKCPEL